MAQEILVSINVNSGKAEARLKGVKKATDQTKISTELYEKSINDLTQAELRQIIAEQKVVVQRKITTKSVQQLAAAELSAAEAAKGNRAQSGLSNAILLETGRLASDASFGFTAIANNLSQLVTLFQSFAETSGGFRNSLKRLGESLMGSAGLLIAIQLLISFGPKLYEFFRGAAGEAEKFKKALDEATKSINLQKVELMGYLEVLKDTSVSEAVRLNATQEIASALPHLVDEQGKLKVSYEDLNAEIEKYIEQSLIRAEIDVLLEENEEKFRLRRELRNIEEIEDEEERMKARMAFMEEETGFFEASAYTRQEQRERARMTQEERDLQDFTRFSNRIESQAKLVVDEIEALQKQLEGRPPSNDGGSKARQRRLKAFIAGQKDYEKETEKSQKRLLDMFFKDEKARVINANQTRIQLLRITQEQFKEREKARLAAYIKERDDDIKAEKAKKKVDQKRIDELNAAKVQATKDSNAEIEKSEKSLSTAIVSINNETTSKLDLIDQERAQNVIRLNQQGLIAQAQLQDQLGELPKIFQDKERDERMKQLKFQIGVNKDLLMNFSGTEEEKQKLLLETFNLQKQLSKLVLADEEAKFQQIKLIYTDGFSAVTRTATAFNNVQTNNLEDQYERRIEAASGNVKEQERLEQELADKKDKIAKKQFRIEQVAKISKALMDTYQAGFRAYGSQIIIGDPSSPIRAQIAQAAAIANGLAQVAVIASQKYRSPNRKAVSGRGAAGGGVEVEAPDFNVVGASPIGQLVGGVGAAIGGKPIKAYVSGKDILDSMQEYERNVNNSST